MYRDSQPIFNIPPVKHLLLLNMFLTPKTQLLPNSCCILYHLQPTPSLVSIPKIVSNTALFLLYWVFWLFQISAILKYFCLIHSTNLLCIVIVWMNHASPSVLKPVSKITRPFRKSGVGDDGDCIRVLGGMIRIYYWNLAYQHFLTKQMIGWIFLLDRCCAVNLLEI